jgi:hypothetical protein
MARVRWNETVYSAMLSFEFLLKVTVPLLLFALTRKHLTEINMINRAGNLLWFSVGMVLLRRATPGVAAVTTVSLEEYLRGLKSYQEALYVADSGPSRPKSLGKRLLRNV